MEEMKSTIRVVERSRSHVSNIMIPKSSTPEPKTEKEKEAKTPTIYSYAGEFPGRKQPFKAAALTGSQNA
jgi:hypothetical protein